MTSFLYFLSFSASGRWECLVFHGESCQGTEGLASKLKEWHGATFTQKAELDVGVQRPLRPLFSLEKA